MNGAASFQLIDQLFRAALRLADADRGQFLDEHCGVDTSLKHEILQGECNCMSGLVKTGGDESMRGTMSVNAGGGFRCALPTLLAAKVRR